MEAKNLITLSPSSELEAACQSPADCDRVNPFERASLLNYQSTLWSPSVFDNVSMAETPPQSGWTVDQMSRLYPAPIEESPTSHTNAYLVDSITEAKAQADIDIFFSTGQIAPSPENLIRKKLAPLYQVMEESRSESKSNGWTQTELSLPPVLPSSVEEVLAPYFQNGVSCGFEPSVSTRSSQLVQGQQEEVSEISLETVRRRLNLSFGDRKETTSPNPEKVLLSFGDPFVMNHVISSPSRSTGFESSPLQSSTADLEAQFRRCEFTPVGKNPAMNSPEITPIRDDEVFEPAKTSTPNPPPLSNLTVQELDNRERWSQSSTPTGQLKSTVRRNGFRPRKSKASSTVAVDSFEIEDSHSNSRVGTTQGRNRRRHSTPEEKESPRPNKIHRSGSDSNEKENANLS